jgi:glycosyltransferase involved in cell wall biosynthesis
VKIAIDASTISTQGGPRTYVLGLLDALLTMDRDNEYLVFYNDPCHLGRFPRAREIVVPGKSPLARLWREHWLVPRICRREGVDILHCPKSAIPFFSPCPTVVTLHDLIPLRHPETEKLAARLYWRLQMPIAARRSSFIITDSEHARREIMEEFQVAPERIKALMLGFDPDMLKLRDSAAGAAVRAKYGLPDGYILYVGTIQPRKNINTLIEAYQLLKQQRNTMPKLVIVGRKGWLYDSLFARISELGLANEVLFTGFVPDEELPFLYDGARLFAYLSFFEGFGLPPLEAMACGIPVVTSNTTSLPEVVGDAGLTVPPAEVDRVAAAIARILDDAGFAKQLGLRGKERAQLFSWEAAARETLEIYRKVAGKDIREIK